MGSLPLGCNSHPVPVVLSRGGSRSSCVNILLLNFQGQRTQSLGCWEVVGWEKVRGEKESRPSAIFTWKTRQTVLTVCCRTACGPPFLCLLLSFQANSYLGVEVTLLDPTCKARTNGTHFILESPLNGCGTRHRRSAPNGVVYYNSVSVLQNEAWPCAGALPH